MMQSRMARGFRAGSACALLSILFFSTYRIEALPVEVVVQAEGAQAAPLRLLFVGDMMFDRYIRTVGARGGHDFILAPISDWLHQYDWVIGNLEGPITDAPSTSEHTRIGETGNMRFTFHPDTASLLPAHNIRLVSIGNNHVLDQGWEGAAETMVRLEEVGVLAVGNPANPGGTVTIAHAARQITFVGYNQFIKDSYAAVHTALSEIPQTHYTVVLAHWGEEYTPYPTEAVREHAHEFIDAGADLVIGTHSHVAGAVEQYENGVIYYSLGNFVFDQYFSPETMEGLAVEVVVGEDNETFFEHRIRMRPNGQTLPPESYSNQSSTDPADVEDSAVPAEISGTGGTSSASTSMPLIIR